MQTVLGRPPPLPSLLQLSLSPSICPSLSVHCLSLRDRRLPDYGLGHQPLPLETHFSVTFYTDTSQSLSPPRPGRGALSLRPPERWPLALAKYEFIKIKQNEEFSAAPGRFRWPPSRTAQLGERFHGGRKFYGTAQVICLLTTCSPLCPLLSTSNP